MTDHPMIFTSTVPALIAGRKTQTRRIVNGQPEGQGWFCDPAPGGWRFVAEGGAPSMPAKVPWRAGDRIWVREAWCAPKRWDDTKPSNLTPRSMSIRFEADGGWISNKDFKGDWRPWHEDESSPVPEWVGKLRSPLHLPRWASRLTLHVTEVRVQRLLNINEADARAEGVEEVAPGWFSLGGASEVPRAEWAFGIAWDKLHGEGAFVSSPWVAAISFRVVLANIDAPEAQIQEAAA